MPKPFHVPLLFISVASVLALVRAQEAPATNHTGNLKTLVVATEAKSDAAIAIPPIASVTINLKNDKHGVGADAVDLTTWLSKEAALNGLQSTDLQPWHIVVTYDQFDEDGDNVRSGVYEEYWAGAKKYKRIYKSDNLNETDYATEKGLYRLGDQQWPDRAQLQVRGEIVDPFSYAATLVGFHGRTVEQTFSGYQLQCVMLEKDSEISNPTQYCFEPDGSVLRYSKGFGFSRGTIGVTATNTSNYSTVIEWPLKSLSNTNLVFKRLGPPTTHTPLIPTKSLVLLATLLARFADYHGKIEVAPYRLCT